MVKEVDLKSTGFYPRRFESCRHRYSSVAQWIAREAHNLKVIGSIPFTAEDRVSSVGRAPDF